MYNRVDGARAVCAQLPLGLAEVIADVLDEAEEIHGGPSRGTALHIVGQGGVLQGQRDRDVLAEDQARHFEVRGIGVIGQLGTLLDPVPDRVVTMIAVEHGVSVHPVCVRAIVPHTEGKVGEVPAFDLFTLGKHARSEYLAHLQIGVGIGSTPQLAPLDANTDAIFASFDDSTPEVDVVWTENLRHDPSNTTPLSKA